MGYVKPHKLAFFHTLFMFASTQNKTITGLVSQLRSSISLSPN